MNKKNKKKVHATHVEVLKRADGLLCFMADHDKIDEAHLNLLWAAGKGQPDAQVRPLGCCYSRATLQATKTDMLLSVTHNNESEMTTFL